MKHARVLRWLIAVTFLAFVAFGLLGFIVEMDVVARAPGELRPIRYAEIRPPVEGLVREVYRSEGERVKAGDPILRLDSSEEELEREVTRKDLARLRGEVADLGRVREEAQARSERAQAAVKAAAAEIAQRKAELTHAQAALKQAQAAPDALERKNAEEAIQQAEIGVKDAQKAAEDAQALFDKGMASEQSLHTARSALETAQSRLRVHRNRLEMLGKTRLGAEAEQAAADLAARNAALDGALARLEERRSEAKLAELAVADESAARRLDAQIARAELTEQQLTRTIQDRTLCAPISGLLYDFHIKPGQSVTTEERAGWIYDTSDFLFYARVRQVDMPTVQGGQPAELYSDALPYRIEGTFPAEVAQTAEIALPPSGGGGEETGLFRNSETGTPEALVILKLPPGDGNAKLRVGYTGFAEIRTGRASLLGMLFGRRKR